ncbi:hypothetical protein TMUPMC115_1923 [Tetragenococcus muriaticus PMC-11-5]|uniref:Uncharacterized protein n=1 Tax=Tetragenococcus muriaticus PMC-11-5 TaxID=1302649 RepID=A0A091CCJ5_9ENTE|nr:hypothetical protein TMUPMC115_1923 [Tetragenococcus muriaticus PMC-11-5]
MRRAFLRFASIIASFSSIGSITCFLTVFTKQAVAAVVAKEPTIKPKVKFFHSYSPHLFIFLSL